MPTVGVVIFSTEGTKHLAECLDSVDWADEILVVHAGRTAPELAGLARLPIKLRTADSLVEAVGACDEIGTDWVLSLWGEERVAPELQKEVQALSRGELGEEESAYRIAIRSYLLGGWAIGAVSGASPALRLYRKGASGGLPLDAGRAGVLRRGRIDDYSCAELSRGLDHIQVVSDFWARRPGVTQPWPGGLRAVFDPLWLFLRILFANRIFFHGLAGVAMAALAGYTVLLTGAKLWEAKHAVARESASKRVP